MTSQMTTNLSKDSDLPELPQEFALHCGVRLDPPKTNEMFGYLYGDDKGQKQKLYSEDQMRDYARKAIAASPQLPVADQVTLRCCGNMIKQAGNTVCCGEPIEVQAFPSAPDVLLHMSKYWEHQWHDGDQHLVRISREKLEEGICALLAAPPTQAIAAEAPERTQVDSKDECDRNYTWYRADVLQNAIAVHSDALLKIKGMTADFFKNATVSAESKKFASIMLKIEMAATQALIAAPSQGAKHNG